MTISRFIAGMLLISFLASVAAYVRSYFAWDSVWMDQNGVVSPENRDHGYVIRSYVISSTRGDLCIHMDEAEDRNIAGWDANGGAIAPTRPTATRTFGWSSTLPGALDYPTSNTGWHHGAAGLQFGWTYFQGAGAGSEVSYVIVPHWLLTLISGTLTLIFGLPVWREFSRKRNGLCSVCGYDLQASPEKCPECGNIANMAAKHWNLLPPSASKPLS